MNLLQYGAIQELAQRTLQADTSVLSVYLNLDPAHPANRRGGHKLVLEQMLKELESQIETTDKLAQFQAAAEWVRQKMEYHLVKGKSLVLFCNVNAGLYVKEDLPIRLANQAWFEEAPYVRPLLQARDEYARYGVVLVDRERAHYFLITMGTIEEVSDLFQSPPVKHRSTSGSDHMRSQMVLQRRAATWSNWFLKDVAEMLHDMMQRHDLDRILLAGPEDLTAELQRLLPKTVSTRVAGRVRISVTAKAKEVLAASRPVIEALEQEQEQDLVQDLITIARKNKPTMEKAVLGFNATLDAINQGRVHRLVYPNGLKARGYRCLSNDVLLDTSPMDGKCPYCSKSLEELEDLIWLASERVLRMGGSIEEIRNPEMSAQLQAVGGIGAYLR